MCFLFYRGSCTKQTSSVKISASNAQSASLTVYLHLHTTNKLTTGRFLKLVWFLCWQMRLICGLHHGFITGFAAFWWCSRRVITSLHNVPMATGENGCSCVKQTQHFSTFCWDICDFFAMKMRGLWNHASPAYFARKLAIYATKVSRIWKNAAPA